MKNPAQNHWNTTIVLTTAPPTPADSAIVVFASPLDKNPKCSPAILHAPTRDLILTSVLHEVKHSFPCASTDF